LYICINIQIDSTFTVTIAMQLKVGLDDIISVLQQNRLHWYGHVLRKEDNDWVKKWMKVTSAV